MSEVPKFNRLCKDSVPPTPKPGYMWTWSDSRGYTQRKIVTEEEKQLKKQQAQQTRIQNKQAIVAPIFEQQATQNDEIIQLKQELEKYKPLKAYYDKQIQKEAAAEAERIKAEKEAELKKQKEEERALLKAELLKEMQEQKNESKPKIEIVNSQQQPQQQTFSFNPALQAMMK